MSQHLTTYSFARLKITISFCCFFSSDQFRIWNDCTTECTSKDNCNIWCQSL